MPRLAPLAPQIRAIAAEAELRARMESRPVVAATLLRLAEVLRYDAEQAAAGVDATEAEAP